MKLNKSEKTGDTRYEMEIFIEPDVFKEAVSKVYRRDAKKYNVPGFRRGKAPRNLIERMYGEDFFHSDAINDLFPDVFEEAVKEAGIEPVDRPEVKLVSSSVQDGVVVETAVTIKPEVKIGKYTGLSVTKTVQEIDENQVEEEIKRMQERNARIVTRDDAAQDGDIANIDYEGSVDDVPFDGGKGEDFKLTLGSGQFIPGFEEQVVGHKAGEEFDVNVTFPEQYHSDELAGKAAVFKVKLNEVQYKEMPELDDEFAKDVSEYETLEELKQSIRDNIKKTQDESAEIDVENKLAEQIVETIEGDIPEVMFENRMDEMVQDFNIRLQQQGLNLRDYLKYSGMDMKAFRDGFREQAEHQVKMRLALETVARLEKIEALQEDIDKEVETIAEKYSMEAEKVRELMPTDEIAKDLAVRKAIDFVKSKATIKEEKVKKEPAAKEEGEGKKEAAQKTTKKAKKPAVKAENKKKDDAGKAKEEKAD